MGIGQIVTLRLPPHLINVVNVEIERCAWGAFSTEFFPTYDFIPVRERLAREWREPGLRLREDQCVAHGSGPPVARQ